ncbi:MAG: zinc ABC transporter substrate-binding protein [Desulfurococcales archaeon]|nr:zinc ABC transporter substrate-binding protein [Desulfurococcales archaeon]
MERRVAYIVLVMLIVSALLLAVIVDLRYSGIPGGAGSGTLILTTFPGIDGDVANLLRGCSNVTVKPIAPAGADPHSYQLRPDDLQLLAKSTLIISTGHAPFEKKVEELYPDKTLNISAIPGIKLSRLPQGGLNMHMPIYDPDNYKVFIKAVADRVSQLVPQCKGIVYDNLEDILLNLSRLDSYKGALNGTRGVTSSPLGYYAVSWLGVDIEVYLVQEHGAQVSPDAAEEAETLLRSGGLAIIIVDAQGHPLGQANTMLETLAEKYKAPTIKVEAPFTDTPIIAKIWRIVKQAENLGT